LIRKKTLKQRGLKRGIRGFDRGEKSNKLSLETRQVQKKRNFHKATKKKKKVRKSNSGTERYTWAF